jgi:hypothetical protein
MTKAENNGYKRAMWVLQIGYCGCKWGMGYEIGGFLLNK